MSDDAMVNSPAVAIVRKNALEDVRVNLTEYRGYDLVDVRVFAEPRSGTGPRIPTKAGISLKIEHLPELIEALQRAERKARDAGASPRNRAERRRREAGIRRHLHKMNRAAGGLVEGRHRSAGHGVPSGGADRRGDIPPGRPAGRVSLPFVPPRIRLPARAAGGFCPGGAGQSMARIDIGSVAGICPEHASLPDAVLVDAAFASVLGRGLSLGFKVVPAHAVHAEGGRA